MKITLREFFDSKVELAIRCKTEEKAKTLLTAFDKMGKTWCLNSSYLELTNFRTEEEDSKFFDGTCYTNQGGFCHATWFRNRNTPIYEFEDVIFPEVVKVKEPKPFKVFDTTYLVHDYALENLVGKENAMSSRDLAKHFDISERRLRDIRVNHNDPRSNFQHLLLTCQKGYFIASALLPEEAKKQYEDTAYRLIHHAVSELREAKRLLKQTTLDGTMRLKLTPYMKETYEIYVDLTKGE